MVRRSCGYKLAHLPRSPAGKKVLLIKDRKIAWDVRRKAVVGALVVPAVASAPALAAEGDIVLSSHDGMDGIGVRRIAVARKPKAEGRRGA